MADGPASDLSPRERWVPSQVTCCTSSGLCPLLLHYFALFGQSARAPQAECHPKRARAMACRAVAHQAFGVCLGALRLDGSPTKIDRYYFVIVPAIAVLGDFFVPQGGAHTTVVCAHRVVDARNMCGEHVRLAWRRLPMQSAFISGRKRVGFDDPVSEFTCAWSLANWRLSGSIQWCLVWPHIDCHPGDVSDQDSSHMRALRGDAQLVVRCMGTHMLDIPFAYVVPQPGSTCLSLSPHSIPTAISLAIQATCSC